MRDKILVYRIEPKALNTDFTNLHGVTRINQKIRENPRNPCLINFCYVPYIDNPEEEENMFKKMRRNEKSLPESEMMEILNSAEYGVLSTIGENGYPYGVPVNFLFHDNIIYFHCAKEGHKLDNIAFCNKVSFSVVKDVSVMAESFTTKFRSVILFGKASEVHGDIKQEVFVKFMEKFSKDYMEAAIPYIRREEHSARLYQVEVEFMTAKGKK